MKAFATDPSYWDRWWCIPAAGALLRERDSASLEVPRAEQRYAQIFNGRPPPLWVHGRDSLRFLLVNDAAVRSGQRISYAAARVNEVGKFPILISRHP